MWRTLQTHERVVVIAALTALVVMLVGSSGAVNVMLVLIGLMWIAVEIEKEGRR